MELDEALLQWYEEVKREYTYVPQEQTEITKAGAVTIKPDLVKATPYNSDIDTDEHIRDSITTVKGNVDGEIDGTSTLGWDRNYGHTAHIARFMNDGTKFYPKKGGSKNHLGFYNRFISSESVKNKMLNAEAIKFKEILNRKDHQR